MSSPDMACAVPGCPELAEPVKPEVYIDRPMPWHFKRSLLCTQHRDLAARQVPRHSKAWGERHRGDWTDEELAAVAAQVERDALPLTFLALNWCCTQALRRILPETAA